MDYFLTEAQDKGLYQSQSDVALKYSRAAYGKQILPRAKFILKRDSEAPTRD